MEKRTVHYIDYNIDFKTDLPNVWLAGINAGRIHGMILAHLPEHMKQDVGVIANLGLGGTTLRVTAYGNEYAKQRGYYEADVEKLIADLNTIPQ